MSSGPIVQVQDLAKTFDVSAPWLNRVLERKPRLLENKTGNESTNFANDRELKSGQINS